MDIFQSAVPKIIRKAYKSCVWEIPNVENEVFLTFDDGPTPGVTEKVLDLLKTHNAKATFFCVGKNAAAHPDLMQRIIAEGHSVGNHTFEHLNGWKTETDIYVKSTEKAREHIKSNLFRPPYGKIKSSQINNLRKDYQIIMWSILTGDYDENRTPKQCFETVSKNIKSGSIIVCHDSLKASKNCLEILPKILELNFCFKGILLKDIP